MIHGAGNLRGGVKCARGDACDLRCRHDLARRCTDHCGLIQPLGELDVLALEVLVQHVAAKLGGGLFDRIGQAVGRDDTAGLQQTLASHCQHGRRLGRTHALEDVANLVEGLQRQLFGGVLDRTLGHSHAGVIALDEALASSSAGHAGEQDSAQRRSKCSNQRLGDLRRVGRQLDAKPWHELIAVPCTLHRLVADGRHVVGGRLGQVLGADHLRHALQLGQIQRAQNRVDGGLVEEVCGDARDVDYACQRHGRASGQSSRHWVFFGKSLTPVGIGLLELSLPLRALNQIAEAGGALLFHRLSHLLDDGAVGFGYAAAHEIGLCCGLRADRASAKGQTAVDVGLLLLRRRLVVLQHAPEWSRLKQVGDRVDGAIDQPWLLRTRGRSCCGLARSKAKRVHWAWQGRRCTLHQTRRLVPSSQTSSLVAGVGDWFSWGTAAGQESDDV